MKWFRRRCLGSTGIRFRTWDATRGTAVHKKYKALNINTLRPSRVGSPGSQKARGAARPVAQPARMGRVGRVDSVAVPCRQRPVFLQAVGRHSEKKDGPAALRPHLRRNAAAQRGRHSEPRTAASATRRTPGRYRIECAPGSLATASRPTTSRSPPGCPSFAPLGSPGIPAYTRPAASATAASFHRAFWR